jgi:hypothetical protein
LFSNSLKTGQDMMIYKAGNSRLSRRQVLRYGFAGLMGAAGGVLAVTALTGTDEADFIPGPKTEARSKAYWNTYCLGRFLIDCPPTAIITNRYGKIWGTEFVWRKDLTPEAARREALMEIDKLKKTPHEKVAGNMYIDTVELPNGGIAIVGWEVDYSVIFFTYQCYFVVSEDEPRVFSGGFLAEAGRSESQQYILKIMQDIALSLRSLNDGEIPAEAGFCFEGGISRHNGAWRAERAGMDFTLPEAPGMTFGLSIRGRRSPDGPFLKRNDVLAVLEDALRPGVRVLRRGKVMLGDVAAEELVRIDASRNPMWHENTLYDFELEAPNLGERLDRPWLRFTMNNYLSIDEETLAFRSDKEALDLWDALSRSIRLRPGAV